MHGAIFTIDARDVFIQMQGNAVFRVPINIVQHDVFNRLLARQYRRQQDAVVVGVGLSAEHGDLIEIRRDLEQLL